LLQTLIGKESRDEEHRGSAVYRSLHELILIEDEILPQDGQCRRHRSPVQIVQPTGEVILLGEH